MHSFKKVAASLLTLAMATTLVACGTTTSSTSTNANTSSTATSDLYGTPWVTSNVQGNLPSEQPEAKDDVYTHYNYEYLASHQEQPSSVLDDHASEMKDTIATVVKDESKTSHDIEQLRILYNQAADTEALQATGLSEVQPYLDRIDAVGSLDEMNALLTAEDFPFSPFILASVTLNDTRSNNIVSIEPNFVFCNSLLVGGTLYQDSDDAQTQKSTETTLQNLLVYTLIDFRNAGMEPKEAKAAGDQVLSFEKAHGKFVPANGSYLKADYGAMAQAARESYFTLDEACALAPNFPLKATLEQQGKSGSETYAVTKKWITAFNDLWTEDNLETIKLVAKAQVLSETRPFRDPTAMDEALTQGGMAVSDAQTFALEACSNIHALGDITAKTYVEEGIGSNAQARLTKLSQRLIDTYKSLVTNTTWLGDESRQRIIEKLDHITLNVLEPTGGYFDYSGLNLTPTDQGGTLFSNYLKCKQYHQDCENKLIGQPAVAASPWFAITPTTNNAFYDPMSNSINILPGFVSSVVYNDSMSDAELLGVAGWTIGHEISHGFDYTGSQIDAYGTPNPVYSDADVDKFVLKSSTLALYYSKLEIAPGQTVSGELVAGEATADLCGMQACLKLAESTDGFDYDSYFASVSNMWAEVITKDKMQQQTLDTHPMNNLRVNVNFQMFDVTYDKLGITEGDGMYLAPSERIVIWDKDA